MGTDLQGSALPSWAVRIRREREGRSWSVPEAVRALETNATYDEAKGLPAQSTLIRRWRSWEAGEHNPAGGQAFFAPIIARTFGTAMYALFPKPKQHSSESELIVATGLETADILARINRSDVDSATLDAISLKIEQLCSEYPHLPSEQLLETGRKWLAKVVDLRGHRLTLAQHRDVLVASGWLALLVGCVENDTGDRTSAEATRRLALSIGKDTGSGEIIGWAHEMQAWFALTDGDYRGVVNATRNGLEVSGSHGVGVQLLAQEAKAWARIGDRRQMEVALDKGRKLLDQQPYPNNLDNHFVVDPAKFDFYAMDCYRIAHIDALASTYANEVIRSGTDFVGEERSPMRNAEARITLGVIAGREGDAEQAIQYGNLALEGDRKSLPSLLMVSRELGHLANERFGKQPAARDYIDRLHSLRNAAA